jgi:hypothetical protein
MMNAAVQLRLCERADSIAREQLRQREAREPLLMPPRTSRRDGLKDGAVVFIQFTNKNSLLLMSTRHSAASPFFSAYALN